MSLSDWVNRYVLEVNKEAGTETRHTTLGHYMDEIYQDALARGTFDDLPGKGKPQNIDSDPYAGPDAELYKILQEANVLPDWLERRKEIVATLAWVRDNPGAPDLVERVAKLNEQIRAHNKLAPPQLHVPGVRLDQMEGVEKRRTSETEGA